MLTDKADKAPPRRESVATCRIVAIALCVTTATVPAAERGDWRVERLGSIRTQMRRKRFHISD